MRVANFLTRTKVRTLPGFKGQVLKVTEIGDRAIAFDPEDKSILADGLPWNLLRHKDGIEGWSATTDGTDTLYVLEALNPRFVEAVAFTLEQEGGYTWDENDPGGETNYGISKRSYPDYNIKAMTKEQAQVIYLIDYWNRLACYNLPWPMALFVFDVGVLCGVPHTLPLKTLAPGDFLATHLEYLCGLTNFNLYGRGWVRRVADLLTHL